MVCQVERAPRKPMRLVSVWRINVLPQMRKSFDQQEQQELTESIEKKGMLNAPILVLFTLAELRQYLKVINRLWKSSIAPVELKSSIIKGEQMWYILLAGERRLRSYRLLVEAKKKSRLLHATVHQHLDPLDAIDMQFSENCHRRVPPHEEAYAYGEYWSLLSARNGEPPTYSSFAKRVGRSSGAIKSALLFVSLPAVIRHAVAGEWGTKVPQGKIFCREKLRLPYGIAVELARLSERGRTEPELIELMIDAVLFGTKVEKFREQINRIITEQNGQGLLALMSKEAEKEERLVHRRRTVESGVNNTLCGWEAWMARVITLFDAGLLGKNESPFAIGSVRQRMVTIATLYEQIFKSLYRRPSPAARQRFAKMQEVKMAIGKTA